RCTLTGQLPPARIRVIPAGGAGTDVPINQRPVAGYRGNRLSAHETFAGVACHKPRGTGDVRVVRRAAELKIRPVPRKGANARELVPALVKGNQGHIVSSCR